MGTAVFSCSACPTWVVRPVRRDTDRARGGQGGVGQIVGKRGVGQKGREGRMELDR